MQPAQREHVLNERSVQAALDSPFLGIFILRLDNMSTDGLDIIWMTFSFVFLIFMQSKCTARARTSEHYVLCWSLVWLVNSLH